MSDMFQKTLDYIQDQDEHFTDATRKKVEDAYFNLTQDMREKAWKYDELSK